MYFKLLLLIRWIRRMKRRLVKRIGHGNAESFQKAIELLLEWTKNLSGLNLLVPVIALASAPAHFTSQGYSWKTEKPGLFPTPQNLLFGVASICIWVLLSSGSSKTNVLEAIVAKARILGSILAISALSPIWLLLVTILILAVALLFKVIFHTDWMLRNVFLDELDTFLVLLSPPSWRRVDWPRFYYYLCYFWIYASLVICIVGSILFVLWFFPAFLILGLISVFPKLRENLHLIRKDEFEDDLKRVDSLWHSSRPLWILLLFFFLRPTIRYIIKPYAILFCNCLKMPSEASFKAQFKELNDKAAELFWPDEDCDEETIHRDLRYLTSSAISTLRCQERRACKSGLRTLYLQERSLHALGFMGVRQYLDRAEDHRLLSEIDDLMAGKPLLRIYS